MIVSHTCNKIMLFALILGLSLAVPTGGSSRERVIKEPMDEVGLASYYARKLNGRRTASGERYDMHALTAAHRSLEFGSLVEVTNLKNGRKVKVRINDRGPFKRGRIIDLSYAAAKEIGMLSQGVVKVRVKALER
ncbi:MAG: septal ring lytic transglycosylase RlpA family protein [Deltaproteobacteria bacterium]|jgi:rare lipoprotein A